MRMVEAIFVKTGQGIVCGDSLSVGYDSTVKAILNDQKKLEPMKKEPFLCRLCKILPLEDQLIN